MSFVKCQAGHKKHDTMKVSTALGEMTVWDYEKYMDFHGYCTGQDALSQVLSKEEYWEFNNFKPVNKILEVGDRSNLVIDVGSHIGWYSKMARNLGYDVVAIEADPENCELTKLNAPGTDVRNIWLESGVEPLVTDRTIEFVKIDIEGAEEYAIDYLRLVMVHQVKNMMMEISPCFNDSYPALLERLKLLFKIEELDGTPFDFKYNFSQKDLILRRL